MRPAGRMWEPPIPPPRFPSAPRRFTSASGALKRQEMDRLRSDLRCWAYGVSFKGTVKNGVVVLPPDAKLPDGTPVEVIADEKQLEDDPFVAAVLKVARPRPHWPRDYVRNLNKHL